MPSGVLLLALVVPAGAFVLAPCTRPARSVVLSVMSEEDGTTEPTPEAAPSKPETDLEYRKRMAESGGVQGDQILPGFAYGGWSIFKDPDAEPEKPPPWLEKALNSPARAQRQKDMAKWNARLDDDAPNEQAGSEADGGADAPSAPSAPSGGNPFEKWLPPWMKKQ